MSTFENFKAPEHLVDLISAVAPEPRRINGITDPKAWRESLGVIAQAIWMQGWHSGATYQASIAPARMIVTTEEMEEIKKKFQGGMSR